MREEVETSNAQRPTSNVERKTKPFVCRYFHDGVWWGLDLHAYDAADVEARVNKLGNLQVLGELKGRIPAVPAAGWFVQAVCAVRNFFAGGPA